MLKLKQSCRYFKRVHQITLDIDEFTSGDWFDKVIADVLDHFKPRVIKMLMNMKMQRFLSPKVQFRVPQLTLEGHEDMLEYVLNKVIPTHSLRIIQTCKIETLQSLITNFNLKHLECSFTELDQETITLFDSFPIKTKLIQPLYDPIS